MSAEEPRPTLDLRKPIKTRDGKPVKIRYIVGAIDDMLSTEGETAWNVYGEKTSFYDAMNGGTSYGVNGDFWWNGLNYRETSKYDLVQDEDEKSDAPCVSDLELSEAIKASGHVDCPSVRRWMRRALEAAKSVKNTG